MKNKTLIIIILVVLNSMSSLGQDSIRIDSELSIITKGQHNLSALVNNFDCFHCITGEVEDNPFFHLGVYTGIDYKLTLNEKFILETGLYLEERSYSGGNNTIANWVLFPRIKITAEDTLRINNEKLLFSITGGDFWDEDVNDMLRLYNIDYHALMASIKIEKLSFEFMTIGDLSRNIGLDLHQLYRFSLAYETNKFKNVTSINVNEVFAAPRGEHLKPTDINISNYFRFQFKKQIGLEGQAEFRMVKDSPISSALGMKLNYKSERIKLSTAVRYYESEFNQGYNGRRPRYSSGNNYVGTQLYPLKNYYRDFSQWAVYTHMEDQDLLAFVFSFSWESNREKRIGYFCDLDVNYIYDMTNSQDYFYPIYNAGFQANFLKVFNGRISVTNKHMDLRNFYQTFSVSKIPFLSLGVSLEIDKLRLKTVYMKR